MAELFGFEIRRKQEIAQQTNPSIQTFAPEAKDDGAVVVAAGGAYGTYVDMEGSARTEADLVNKYREIAQHPEVDAAIDDIVNEAEDTLTILNKYVDTMQIQGDRQRLDNLIRTLYHEALNVE